jgi:hypothetical protein
MIKDYFFMFHLDKMMKDNTCASQRLLFWKLYRYLPQERKGKTI